MNDAETLARNLVRLVPLLMRTFGVNMRCYRAGLAPAHYRILGALANEGGSVSQLADRHAVTMATMSNSVAALVERGLVERVPSQLDRRVVQVHITPTGRQALAEMHEQIEQYARGLFIGLPPEEIEKMDEGLNLLRRVLENTARTAEINCADVQRGEIA